MYLRKPESRSLKRQRSGSYSASDAFLTKKRWCSDGAVSREQADLTHQALVELNRQTRNLVTRRSVRLRRQDTRKRLCSIANADLQRFARGGGPDLTAIRGYPDPTMTHESDPGKNSKQTTTNKASSAYDPDYFLKLHRANIEVEEGDILPTNYDDIMFRLQAARPSLSSSRFAEQDFRDFRKLVENSTNENEVMQQAMPVIAGARGSKKTHLDVAFNNLDPLGPDLAMAIPDIYDGISPFNLDARVLKDLSALAVPSTESKRAVVPNFFVEGKSSRGRADVAKLQARHNAALGTRGMTALQNFGLSVPVYDEKARTFISTFHDGTLKMYSGHVAAPTQKTPARYYMTHLKSWAMTGDSETFRNGATYFRNARDIAEEFRCDLAEEANQRARVTPAREQSDHVTMKKTQSPLPDKSRPTKTRSQAKTRREPEEVLEENEAHEHDVDDVEGHLTKVQRKGKKAERKAKRKAEK